MTSPVLDRPAAGRILGLLACLTVLLIATPVTATPVTASSGAVDVLFIGNSLIGTPTGATGEDTPTLVRHLASAAGRTLHATTVIHFGNTLQQTWDSGATRTALSGAAEYDYIVLQEYSTLVATALPAARHTMLTTYAAALRGALKPGGRLVLFKNWALADPAPFATHAANVAAIDANYAVLCAALSAALPTRTLLAPISDEFETLIATRGPAFLIRPDGKHPADRAVYLDAATIYGIVFQASPRTLPDLYLPAPTASTLRDVAADALGHRAGADSRSNGSGYWKRPARPSYRLRVRT